jgi:hypothetical protein
LDTAAAFPRHFWAGSIDRRYIERGARRYTIPAASPQVAESSDEWTRNQRELLIKTLLEIVDALEDLSNDLDDLAPN